MCLLVGSLDAWAVYNSLIAIILQPAEIPCLFVISKELNLSFPNWKNCVSFMKTYGMISVWVDFLSLLRARRALWVQSETRENHVSCCSETHGCGWSNAYSFLQNGISNRNKWATSCAQDLNCTNHDWKIPHKNKKNI